MKNGEELAIGSRAWDLLRVMAASAGEIVDKRVLIQTVWPDGTGSENSLRVHMASVRRVLGSQPSGDPFIVNVSGRGYKLAVEVVVRDAGADAPSGRDVPTSPQLLGREELLDTLARWMQQASPDGRLMTLVGPGGVGKTTLARALLRQAPLAADRIGWADLSTCADDHVLQTSAYALSGQPIGHDSMSLIQAAVADAPSMLVLDCCERVVDAASRVVDALLRKFPTLLVLATSREPLRCTDEQVLRIPGLPCPSSAQAATASTESLANCPSVRLFTARAARRGARVDWSRDQLGTVATLCRRLDGIPLMIELAAANVTTAGLEPLGARLAQGQGLAALGPRGAEPRHRSMGDSFTWSYSLLEPDERALLELLSCVDGEVRLESLEAIAGAVTAEEREALFHGVSQLVEKSLVHLGHDDAAGAYRLLDTTKFLARRRLDERRDAQAVYRRVGQVLIDRLRQCRIEGRRASAAAWLGNVFPNVSNVLLNIRAAIDKFHDVAFARELALAAAPVLTQLSLHQDCARLVEDVLSSRADPDDAILQLRAYRGAALLGSDGPTASSLEELESARAGGVTSGNRQVTALALSGLFWLRLYRGEPALAAEAAAAYGRTVASDVGATNNYAAYASTFLGDQRRARALCAAFEATSVVPVGLAMRVGSDPNLFGRIFLAKTLWMSGHGNEAWDLYARCLPALRLPEHGIYYCWALNEVEIPLRAYEGDLAGANLAADHLEHAAARQTMKARSRSARCASLALSLLGGGGDVDELTAEVDALKAGHFHSLASWFDGVIAHGLFERSRYAEGIVRLEDALAWTEATQCRWWQAELLRLRGEGLAAMSNTDGARAAIGQALEVARSQHAVALLARIQASAKQVT